MQRGHSALPVAGFEGVIEHRHTQHSSEDEEEDGNLLRDEEVWKDGFNETDDVAESEAQTIPLSSFSGVS